MPGPGEMPADAAQLLERARADMELGGGQQPTEEFPRVANGEPPSSLIVALRQQQKRIAQRSSTIIEFPPGLWGGLLGIRCQYLDEKGVNRLNAFAANPDTTGAQRASADLLIDACAEIVGRRDPGEEWEPLVPGERIRFDRRLADQLQLDAGDSARSVLIALLGGPTKSVGAITRLTRLYIEWWQGETPEVVADLEGESRPSGS